MHVTVHVRACMRQFRYSETLPLMETNGSALCRTRACNGSLLARTFALAGAEAAALLAGGGGALVEREGLLEAFTAGNFTMHLIGQVPQEAHAVLYQLQMQQGKQ